MIVIGGDLRTIRRPSTLATGILTDGTCNRASGYLELGPEVYGYLVWSGYALRGTYFSASEWMIPVGCSRPSPGLRRSAEAPTATLESMLNMAEEARPPGGARDLADHGAAGRGVRAGRVRIAIVGGPVRDALLGRETHDLDLTTNAQPDDILRIVKPLASATWDIGRAFGTSVRRSPVPECRESRAPGASRDHDVPRRQLRRRDPSHRRVRRLSRRRPHAP
jgi:hypothetical protein